MSLPSKKTVVLILLLLLPVIAQATYATYRHSAFVIGDGKDIDLNGQVVGNGTTKNLTCSSNCSGFNSTQIKLGTFTRDMTTASGTQSITGVGFSPRLILFSAGVSNLSSEGTADVSGNFALYHIENGSWLSTASYAVFLYATPSNSGQSGSVAMTADGFDVAWTKIAVPVAGTAEIIYTAIR